MTKQNNTDDKKFIFVSIGRPIQYKKFYLYDYPTGWIKIDNLKIRLKEDKDFKKQFNKSELNLIKKIK
jgi:hypothetical protein